MKQGKLDGIQVGRGVAALLVLVAHSHLIAAAYFGVRPPSQVSIGIHGVDLFFVISGFIMFWVHEQDFGCPEQLRPYAIKRFVRIYLPYWPALALSILGLVVVPSMGEPWMRAPSAIAAGVVLAPYPDGQILSVAWTLCYEVTFYVVFGLMIYKRQIGVPVFAVWIILAVTMRGAGPYPLSFFTNAYPVHFAIGMGVAFSLRRYQLPGWPWVAAGGLLFFGIWLIEPGRNEIQIRWAYAIASGILVFGLASATAQWPKPLKFAGDASYSIYLAHYPLLVMAAKTLPPNPANPVLAGLIALAGSLLFYITVERTVLKFAHRAFIKRPTSSKPVSV